MNKIKLALLATTFGFTLTSARAASYNGDLIVGFTTQSGNDLVYDIGSQASLTDGQTWDLSTLLSSYNLNVVNWGIIGDKNIGGARTALMTTSGAAPNSIASSAAWSPIDLATKAIYQYFPAAGAGQYETIDSGDASSWNLETTINGLGNNSSYISNQGDPNVAGKTSAPLFGVIANGSAPAKLGTFTLSGSGLLTFNVVSSTPPTPKIVAVTRSGNTSTVFFTTTNGNFTYKLYYTDSAGLTAPVATWQVLPTTVTGNGLTNSLQDVTTVSNRFYRIGVQ